MSALNKIFKTVCGFISLILCKRNSKVFYIISIILVELFASSVSLYENEFSALDRVFKGNSIIVYLELVAASCNAYLLALGDLFQFNINGRYRMIIPILNLEANFIDVIYVQTAIDCNDSFSIIETTKIQLGSDFICITTA